MATKQFFVCREGLSSGKWKMYTDRSKPSHISPKNKIDFRPKPPVRMLLWQGDSYLEGLAVAEYANDHPHKIRLEPRQAVGFEGTEQIDFLGELENDKRTDL